MYNNDSISVIIPTFNGAHKIISLLKALEKQTFKNFEVIIVIDGSTDATKKNISSASWNFSIYLIEQKNQGRSITRNNGAKAAKNNLLVFFDDDMIPSENCIFMHAEHHKENPHSMLVGSTPDYASEKKSDIQKFKEYLGEEWSKNIKKIETPLNKENLFVAAANLSISKETFFALKGFDERLTDAEDYDLGLRAIENGINIYYNHKIVAWHNDPITCKSYIARQREYYKAHRELLTINPTAFSDIQIPANKNIFKKTIYSFFCRKIFVWCIDNFNIFYILPRLLRYRLYALIIWGLARNYPERPL